MLRVKSLAGSDRAYVPVMVRGKGESIHWQVLDPHHELEDCVPSDYRRSYGWAGDGVDSLAVVVMAIRSVTMSSADEGGDA